MPAGCCNIDQCEELTNASSGRRVTSSMKLSITSSVIRFHQSIVFSKILKILTAAVNLFQNSRVTIFPEKCLWNSLKHQHNAFLQTNFRLLHRLLVCHQYLRAWRRRDGRTLCADARVTNRYVIKIERSLKRWFEKLSIEKNFSAKVFRLNSKPRNIWRKVISIFATLENMCCLQNNQISTSPSPFLS